MKKVDILRKKYPRFVYENFDWEISKGNLKISFDFRIENHYESGSRSIYFKPKVVIKNVKKAQIERMGERILDNLVFNLGLIELLSYWKATCSPEILIKAGPLNKEQIKWWKDLINRGMGQFFFENKIDFTKNFLKINFTRFNLVKWKNYGKKLKKRVLVPVGGGKDSIVTLEILKQAKKNITCFFLNLTEITQKIMKIGGCQSQIIVERKIDQKLLELNRQGFLNGHTPLSAYLAFLSVLCAVLFDFKYIAFSNERSSNEGNVKYLGKIINHQYSKSFDFEKKFNYYSKKYLAKNVEYFSFLRPLYEIQIAKLFSKYPKYFPIFLSCNEAFKTHSGRKKTTRKWCGKCPKCLFVFAALYPFVGEEVIRIFRKDLFEDKKLLPLMLELIGERKFKPFECVGTKKESLIAFYLSFKKYKENSPKKLPFLLKHFEEKILNSLPRRISSISERFLRDWSNQHNLPKEFEKILN